MRILVVTNMYPTLRQPAMGTFVEQQVVGLKRIGLEVDVLFVDRWEGGMKSYFFMRTELQNRIQHFDPDAVHVMYGGALAERVTRIVDNRPIILSLCGSDLLGERLSGTLRNIISQFGVIASHIAARRAVGIIVKSRNLEEALPTTVDRSKVRIIPNGIDFERFKPLDRVECRKKLGWNPNKFHVLFPANNGDPVKRPHLAQEAVEAANRSELNAELHQLQGVPHDEVPTWLNASDVVLLTSLHEGSPNIIKEALACDVPIVSVDVGDVRERLNGTDGCHIALPDPKDIGEKLRLVKSWGKQIAGREAVQHLSLEQVSLEIEGFYQEILAPHLKAHH